MSDEISLTEIYRHNSFGYEMIGDPDEPLSEPGCVMHHRVIAYAHGELESVFQPLEVDHLTPIPWLNYEENLEAVGPIEHGRRTVRRRRARADGGDDSEGSA
jgi:hypothetical protein